MQVTGLDTFTLTVALNRNFESCLSIRCLGSQHNLRFLHFSVGLFFFAFENFAHSCASLLNAQMKVFSYQFSSNFAATFLKNESVSENFDMWNIFPVASHAKRRKTWNRSRIGSRIGWQITDRMTEHRSDHVNWHSKFNWLAPFSANHRVWIWVRIKLDFELNFSLDYEFNFELIFFFTKKNTS